MMETSDTAATHAQTARPKRRGGCAGCAAWALVLFWLVMLLAAAGAVGGAASVRRGDRILAGTTAFGHDLGGMTRGEAAALLESDWQSHRIALVAGDESWTLSPAQVGAVLDADATAGRAYRQGRGQITLDGAWPLARRLLATTGLVSSATDPIQVEPVWRFDPDAAAQTLRTLGGQLEIVPQNAGVRVTDGRVEAVPATQGRALDIAGTLATLEQHPWQNDLARPPSNTALRFTLPIVSRTAAITDVSALIDQVTPLLAAPITLQLYDAIRDQRATWSVSPAELGQWLSFGATAAAGESPASPAWSVDEARVADAIAARNATFGDERYVDPGAAVPALIEAFKARQPEIRLAVKHGERTHSVQQGETLSSIAVDYGMPYPWILKANPETGDSLFVGDKITIPSVDGLLPLPVVENKRIRISMKDQRMQAYEDGRVKWDWPISTGIPSSPTSPGVFQIQTHEPMAYAGQWNLYMPWFMGIYRPVPDQEFMNGFHGFPSRDKKQLLWTRNLGHPVTYGCILVDTANAKLLYDWAEPGVVVEIAP